MKIGIFQDIHANLPAFKQGIKTFRDKHCTKIYHVGDLIGIGPYPNEVMQLAHNIKELSFIMGNHDYWYPFGLPNPIPAYMNEEEVAHHRWVHEQIGNDYKDLVKQWQFIETVKFENGKKVSFQHYGLNEKESWFKPHVLHPTIADADHLFEGNDSDMIFYGHNHLASDITGNNRYINLGSAGCFTKPEVSVGILEITNDQLILEKLSIPYDDDGLMEAFETRKVPARKFITSTFLTRP